MGASGLGSRGFKVGSVVFLLLALLLAVISGDLMLILAVGAAVGGVLLLGAHRNLTAERSPVARPTSVDSRPAPSRQAVVSPPAALRPVPVRRPVVVRPIRPVASRSISTRMAVRRSGGASGAGHGRAANPTVSDSPSQVQVIQVLQ
ncbi:MAG TPA: hypothetical protein VN837_01175 [Chloroflexota bacterium]|nr:hypothetical protein [Chloroflexota bacterium]